MKKIFIVVSVMVILMLGSGDVFATGTYLVYDPGGSQNFIKNAMTQLGYTYDVRDSSSPVTAADLAGAYEALVIGWTTYGDYSGLHSDILLGITGNKVLTGHDADYHTGHSNAAAALFMDRIVSFAGSAPGTGIVAFTDWASTPFSYLPGGWGIAATGLLAQDQITSITLAGTASGFYDGLTLGQLSGWGQSYHSVFTGWGSSFESFEVGSEGVVTIGQTVTPYSTPEPTTLLLLGMGFMCLVGIRRK